tara:strand:+ start:58164 stop:59615 length:1452 start_codon:yes stop_codon:yes gene_type:complete
MKRLSLYISTIVVSVSMLFIATAQAEIPTSFADLVEDQFAAVVNVSTSTKPEKFNKSKKDMGRGPLTGDPFLDRFFDGFMGGLENRLNEQNTRPKQSLGSGVVISKDGYIITNNHVVEVADSIVIKFQDGKELSAKVVGKDKKNDLSLLKVETDKDLTFAKLGDSDKIRVGDWTIAIGNPFGLGGTVTAGILSARGRNIHQGPYDSFLQTDAAINPGNSGGPLFNTSGEVIGINTAILSRTGGSQGIGFAVPSNTVKLIVEQIKEHGRPVRGWLGVRIQTVTESLADALGLDSEKGALVAAVIEKSPAEKAGIKEADLILSFDGKDIKEMSDLPKLVAETPVDKTVKLKLMRNNSYKTIEVTIAELEEDEAEVLLSKSDDESDNVIEGMTLSDLGDDEREALGVDDTVKGVVVTSIEFDGRAANSGIKSGDIILEISKEKVASVADVEAMLKKQGDKSMLILIQRDGEKHFLALGKKEVDEDE